VRRNRCHHPGSNSNLYANRIHPIEQNQQFPQQKRSFETAVHAVPAAHADIAAANDAAAAAAAAVGGGGGGGGGGAAPPAVAGGATNIKLDDGEVHTKQPKKSSQKRLSIPATQDETI